MNNFFIFLIVSFSTKIASLFYLFIIYYNFLFVEEIVNLILTNYFLIFLGSFFTPSLSFLESKFLYVNIDYYWIVVSLYIAYRFFLRNLSFYGASLRRESFFIYQNWFRNYKGKSSRELQVTSRITALTTKEFNELFRRSSYVDIDDEDPDSEPILLYHKPYYKDTYKALYYYFLHQNEIKLLKNANDIRRLTYYKDRYGPDVFSYLISREDDKMVKSSLSKPSVENLSQIDAKPHI
jgi:hypothetical protein